MATPDWVGNALTAAELVNLAADKPIIAGSHAGDGLVSAKFVAGLSGTFADGDITDAQLPADLAMDRHGHVRTAVASGSAGTAFTFVMDFGANPPDVDGICFWEHNLGSNGENRIRVQVADDDAFSVDVQTVMEKIIASGDNRRFASWSLTDSVNNPSRISNAQYWRITFDLGSSGIIQLGDVFFTRRRQLLHHSRLPYGDIQEIEKINRNDAGGVAFDFVEFEGKAMLDVTLDNDNSAEKDDLNAWWNDRSGGKAFIWVEKPQSAPNDFYVMKLNSSKKSGLLQINEYRVWRLPMKEQAPHLSAES